MILKEIQNRRSIREYGKEEVSEEQISEIIKAGQFAPSARNNRAVEFVVVRDQKTKDAIFDIAGQDFVKQANVLIIPVTDTLKSSCPADDLAVASENMFLQATSMGLGTVWKALKGELQAGEKIKSLLGIPDNYKAINIIPVGYPENPAEPHSDADFDPKKIHKERW